jgi:hypothetical protein
MPFVTFLSADFTFRIVSSLAGFGGLTISEDGGFEELREFFFNDAISASSEEIFASNTATLRLNQNNPRLKLGNQYRLFAIYNFRVHSGSCNSFSILMQYQFLNFERGNVRELLPLLMPSPVFAN